MENPSTAWAGLERRTSLRLRSIIDELQAGVRENAGAIDQLTKHFVDLSQKVEFIEEVVKRAK